MKRLGKFQLSKKFLGYLDPVTLNIIKEQVYDNVTILVTDIDDKEIYHYYAESELFDPISEGEETIPSYEIVIYTDKEGHMNDFKFSRVKES